MGLIETVTEAAKLAQKLDNIELIKTILALQQQCYEQVFENRELREKLLKAEESLRVRGTLQYRNNAYWLGDTDEEANGPICSPCWDSKGLVVRMHRMPSGMALCQHCNKAVPFGPKRERSSREPPRGRQGWVDRWRD